ncbi:class I SAM-dependent methyltransferase [Halorhodospira neutriphila]|uniref:SAM-dependent methyltransferase n=1 Tax=Halorhodospira neutriphila TaxID=168379 RepID=A0ABS1E8M9_9GAMM|nr:SAM-dependent methyltransferase [Halorhodospira neutriphila]MBK1727045.1 SAM-dependent methyltransferase [Halorhodospira neutriphila]
MARLPDPPPPDAEAQAVSDRLLERIREAIREAGGALPFEQFMDRALYEPGLGYYRAGAARFGSGGDFATAPEFTPLFGRTLARQAAEILEHLGGGDVVELGPGSGALAAAALAELEACGRLPRRWRMLEVSAALRQEQQRTLAAQVPHLLDRVEHLEALPEGDTPAVWIANEVLDALPVRRFVRRGDGVRELAVAADGDGALGWREIAADEALTAAVGGIEARLDAPLPEGYVSEVCTRLPAFLRGVAAALPRGVMLWIDYGYPRREYYHPERRGGTLICHYRHRAHDDPFFRPGLQDLSAFVDFTAVADAGLAAGLEPLGYAPQGGFLAGAGLSELAEAQMAGADERRRLETVQAVQRLSHPGDMGERFKVLALGRGYAGPISGFRVVDRRGSL